MIKISKVFLILFLSLGFYANKIVAQSSVAMNYDTYYARFWDNKLLFNPAYAGSSKNLNIGLAGRSQFSNAPNPTNNFALNADAGNKNFGIGLIALYSTYSGVRDFGARASGAYKMNIKNTIISMGMELGFSNRAFKYADTQINNSQTGFELGAGIYMAHEKYYAGLSMQHIPQVRFSEIDDDKSIIRTLNFMGGFKIGGNPGDMFSVEPNVMMRYDFKNFTADANANVFYKRIIGLGATFKVGAVPSDIGIYGLAINATGILLNSESFQLRLGYAYDFLIGTAGAAANRAGFHEASLGITFKRNSNGNFAKNPIKKSTDED
jgi:type IX secretion system PorP/SprF family membrane protein